MSLWTGGIGRTRALVTPQRCRFAASLGVVCIVLALSAVYSVGAQNPHDDILPEADACARCHRVHSAKGSTAISETSNNALCLTCHDGAGSSKVSSTHSNANAESPVLHFSPQEFPFTLDCVACHDPHSSQDNLCQIWESIGGYAVVYSATTGVDSFDEDSDDDTDTDDICVTCHINITDNSGYPMSVHAGGVHEPAPAYSGDLRATDCTACHPHDVDNASSTDDGFMTCSIGGSGCHGLPPNGSQAPNRDGAHATHYTEEYGPYITSCGSCHSDVSVGDGHDDGTVTFNDGQDLGNTTTCDPCHSGGGAHDGVAEAKASWLTGARISCRGCHDDGNSTIRNVQAPSVVGDGSSYGYDVTGHGKRGLVECTDCHVADGAHIDGDPRTYVAGATDYDSSYRLLYSMTIPLSAGAGWGEDKFELCFECHKYNGILDSTSPYNTNFRDEGEGISSHSRHLSANPGQWDSDWDMSTDSRISCTACHNVHGSPTPQMIRHGELISSPGSADKVPALDFKWSDVYGNATTLLSDSYYGDMPPLGGHGAGSIADSKVCDGCHMGPGEITYYRSPIIGLTDLQPPTMSNVSPTNGASGQPLDVDLTLLLADSEMGVSWSTFTVQLTGDRGYSQTYTASDTDVVSQVGGPPAYDVLIDPRVDFGYGETITVVVGVQDLAPLPNSLEPYAWQFTVHEDTTLPEINDLSPGSGSIDIPVHGNLTFSISDTETGVDWSSFTIEITGPGYVQIYGSTSPEVSHTGNSTSYNAAVDPALDFPNGETMVVSVTVDDMAYVPNTLSFDSWSFATYNAPPTSPTNTSPGDGAGDVPLILTLVSSGFVDPDAGDTHQASQWQVTTVQGDYSSPLYDTGPTGDLTSHTVGMELASSTTYYWHLRHQDDHGEWSDFSIETSFTTVP